MDTICPPIIFRGWDSGASHTPKAKTQLAPNGAISHVAEVRFVKKANMPMAMNPPMKPISAVLEEIFSGLFPEPDILATY
ncbi:hypothetical protein D3C71_2064260 [compost metagenome]